MESHNPVLVIPAKAGAGVTNKSEARDAHRSNISWIIKMNKIAPTVAVIIPSYNRARFVVQALESILNQTRPPDDVVVVDDGSTDGTFEALQPYNDRIRYLHQTNAGKPAALNRAMAGLQADYIWIMDDDDLALPDALDRHLTFLETHSEVEFTYSGCYLFKGEEPPALPERGELYDAVDAPASEFFLRCLEVFPCHTGAMLVPLRCYRHVGPFDETLTFGEDYEMILRLARYFRGGKLARPTFLLRTHEGDRGPAHERHVVSERESAWRVYERETFLRLRRTLGVDDYLPRGSVRDKPSNAQRRQALLQRACVMARHGLLNEALEDIETATEKSLMDEPLTAVEQQLCGRMMNIEPVLLKDRTDFLREVGRVLGRRAPSLLDACVKGLGWSFTRELKSHRYSNAAETAGHLLQLVGPGGSLPLAGRLCKRAFGV
jgi:glycosyltransferase involved in cell wall biosynthesis